MTALSAWAPAAAAVGVTRYVSPTGTSGALDTSCATAAYRTIGAAVAASASGDTVSICAGTYHEGVTVSGKSLTLAGAGASAVTIDAAGQTQGVVIEGPAAAGSVLSGVTVTGAQHEGVLVEGTSHVTVEDVTVQGNDLACQPQVGPNDCGEGVHLEAVTASTVEDSTVTGNTGGILLDDGVPAGSIGATAFGGPTAYSGPTDGNTIVGNTVTDNVWDCGITMPSHNSLAFSGGTPQPTKGGVFGNTVRGNTVTGNGTSGGGGSGILMAAPFPGTASYDNVVEGNTVSGNGQAGITVHSHAPGQDVNGNQFLDNTIGTNGVGETAPGQGVFSVGSSQGDADAGDPATTGIVVYSAVQPITGTVISGNTIGHDYYGIWTANADTALFTSNTTSGVSVPVFVEPPPSSGYVLAAADGGVFAFGAVPFEGSAGALHLAQPVVGAAATPDSGGYWLVARDGGIFAYGDARYLGSLPALPAAEQPGSPVVGMAATPDGGGYWEVTANGDVYSFGDAKFFGSMGGTRLNQPVVGMAAAPSGGGYWLVASDGGIFAFGDAKFFGSMGGTPLAAPVAAVLATGDGAGYWMVGTDGGVFSFGDARFFGSMGGKHLAAPVVAVTAGR